MFSLQHRSVFFRSFLIAVLIVSPFALHAKESNKKAKISGEEALVIVKNIPKVQEWLSLFEKSKKAKGRPVIEIDGVEKGVYLIHVYEVLEDHTATFNWFEVDRKTGEVKALF